MRRAPYTSIVGNLMYAMICIRQDISHIVEVLSKYMNNLGKEHWGAMKWIIKYLKIMVNKTLCYGDIQGQGWCIR